MIMSGSLKQIKSWEVGGIFWGDFLVDVDGFDVFFCGKSQDFRLSLSEKKSVRCR